MKGKYQYKNYTDEDVFEAVKECKSIAGVLKKLGLRLAGGNYNTIKNYLQKFNLNTEHWKGQGWNKDDRLKDWEDYKRIGRLKPHLIKERGHKCEKCQLTDWMGKPIPLELHHKDGNVTNNNLENLELICCNCHSQTDTWRKQKDLRN